MDENSDRGSGSGGRDGIVSVYHIVTPLLAAVVILLNTLVLASVIVVLKRSFVKAKTVYIFLGNVATADLINGILVLVGLYYPRGSREFCIFTLGAIISCTLSSLLSVALIAIDRFLYIMHGMHYRRLMTVRRAYVCIAVTVTASVIIGFVPLVDWSKDHVDQVSCVLVLIAPWFSLLVVAFFGIVPVFAVIVLYAIIFVQALRRADHINKINNTRGVDDVTSCVSNGVITSGSKWRAVKVVFLTTGAFVVTWVPYFTAVIVFCFCAPNTCDTLSRAIASPLAALGFSNSILNPIIYAWWYKGFRKSFQRICCNRRRNLPRPAVNTISGNLR